MLKTKKEKIKLGQNDEMEKVTFKCLNLSKSTLQHNLKFYTKLFSWATLKKTVKELLENIMEKGRRNTARSGPPLTENLLIEKLQ